MPGDSPGPHLSTGAAPGNALGRNPCTAVAFGIWHGLRYSGGSFSFDPMSALIPLAGSIPGGWLRFKTGSLLVPVLGHGIANVAFHVAGGLVA